MIRRTLLAASILALPGQQALACSDVTTVLAHFENVKNAYLEAAPTMKPEQFPVWAGHLETFGNAMSAQDFVGACQALDDAAVELGFNVAAAPTSTVSGGGSSAAATASSGAASGNAAASSGATSGSNVTIGSGVTVGSGVTIGSGSGTTAASGSGAATATAPTAAPSSASMPVRTRARPVRWRLD